MLMSDPVSPIHPDVSAVTLTCTVELSPAVNLKVTVTTVWTGPAGFMTTNAAQPVMGSNTTYTSTAMVNSFGRTQSGNYNCTATVNSTSPFHADSDSQSETARVSVGKADSQLISTCSYPHNMMHRCLSLSKGDSLC